MRRVIVESPYAGDIPRNVRYAQDCLRDSLRRGEAPFASHLLYTQPGVLNDKVQEERQIGIEAGFAWGEVCDGVAVYIDLGISAGMQEGIGRAKAACQDIEYRQIGGRWAPSLPDASLDEAEAYGRAQALIETVLVRSGGVVVDVHGRQAPPVEQYLKQRWARVKTGEIDSEQGVAVAWKALEGTQLALLLNRGNISHRQYMAGEYLMITHHLAGIAQRTTQSYGEARGGGQATYGMAANESQLAARQRLRQARDVMGTIAVPFHRDAPPAIVDLHKVVERLVLHDQGFAQCGRFMCEHHPQLPLWKKTEATERGRTAVLAGLDRLADHLNLNVRED